MSLAGKKPAGHMYQLVPIVSKKDAVGRMALGLQVIGKETGFRSLIFTEKQQQKIGTLSFGALRKGLLEKDNCWAGEPHPELAIYHHSAGSKVAESFLKWPAKKKILIYHNITPPEILKYDQAAHYSKWGLEQLEELVKFTDLEIGFSDFSCRELIHKGAKNVIQLPYLLWNRELKNKTDGRDNNPLILVVGRVEPFKRVLESVKSFLVLKNRIKNAKMAIIGNTKANPKYVGEIRKFLEENRLTYSVQIVGRVSDRKLNHFYQKAHALLTLSDHEGFCVPLIEAMRAGLPIVAFSSGAIPETLREGGILLTSQKPKEVAKTLETVITDSKVIERIRLDQTEQVKRFSWETVESQYSQMLCRFL